MSHVALVIGWAAERPHARCSLVHSAIPQIFINIPPVLGGPVLGAGGPRGTGQMESPFEVFSFPWGSGHQVRWSDTWYVGGWVEGRERGSGKG